MQWPVLAVCFAAGMTIFYQDLRSRSVSWFVFPLLLLSGIAFNLVKGETAGSLFLKALINACFLGGQFLILWLYFSLRKKTGTLFSKIGLGDILFLFSSCFFFSTFNFFLFYILSLIFSLVAFAIFHRSITQKGKLLTVPLAGLQSLFLQAFITINLLLNNNLLTDTWLLNRILFYDK